MIRHTTIIAFVIVALIAVAWAAQRQEPLTWQGPAKIIDGDTLELPQGRVRLAGIDSFEADQVCGMPKKPCGQHATAILRRIATAQTITCTGREFDRYGRLLAHCAALDSLDPSDLGSTLVDTGLALAFTRYSDEYLARERAAQLAKMGAWDWRPFLPPWCHRALKRGAALPVNERCEIGGVAQGYE